MVRIAPFISAVALFSTLAVALPASVVRRQADDSAIGDEVGVSAPNGIPITDSIELASQRSREAAQSTAAQPVTTAANYGASSYGGYDAKAMSKVETLVTATTTVAHTSSSSAAYATTTVASHDTTSSSAYTAMPTYGSGSSNWSQSSEFEDCVQQCVAKFGSTGAQYKPTATSGNSGSVGTGATHTVIVAPTQGVLRYIPFAVNATVGDTIKFMWGANNHTVTKGSALLPCNRTADAVFASGVQNKDFVFTQVVNETSPTYFFCGTPGHCQKGMYGVVNPSTNFNSFSSVSGQMQSIMANNSAVAGYAAYTTKNTASNAAAAKWGGNLNIEAFPEWARPSMVENVLFTRNFLAQNPETLKEDGSIDLSSAESTPLVIPQDIAAVMGSATTAPAAGNTAAAPTSTASTTTETTGAVANAESLNNGAMSGNSPRILVAAMAVVATFMLL
ncbi:glycoamidase [Ephemerocybe angulata]|uniref:Glycoamidase n=1 Tax=Ephemerocybe angulata TaxID=980116 RepID=A0A8H6MDD3_9AGAR|nr:glycoamidase [Tulosesus angulatus]